MAETITLRAYLDDINGLLARGAATEVISHCRYVLQHYPRNIETYRLLAQALLQKAQDQGIEPLFGEAAEVFQRVLGVMPNDYVAHLGLSEIREHENRLDQAIWHMERAYEQIPGNQLLQTALRGLYGKRDGENRTPEKIHLTRGALARQYVNGQLYDQALIELRHALEQNPSRLDLQVMLAETLWESHHPVEAGEMAIQILKKLPDCLPANRILARLWLDNERPSDAQFFLDRVEAMDPYAAADVLQPDTHVPDPNLLTRLDYSTEAQATLSQETPDWIQDLGDMNEADVSSVFQMPPTPAPSKTETPPASKQGVSVDWPGELAETSPDVGDVPDWFAAAEQATTASPAPADSAATELPDWFSELGGQPQQGAESASAAPADADWMPGLDTPEDLFRAGEAAPAEADWLADFGALGEQPALKGEPEPSEERSAEAGSDLDWLIKDETVADASAAEIQPAAAQEDWLAEFRALDEQPSFEGEPETSEGTSAEAGSDSEWLIEDEAVADASAAEVQPAAAQEMPAEEDWLSGFDEVDVSSFEVAQGQAPAEPDWSIEEPSGPAATELQPATEIAEEADWWAASPEAADLFSEEAGGDTVEAGADMRPPSGFTELLAGIEPTQVSGEEPDLAGDDKILPPEWLAAFAGDRSEADQEEALSLLLEDQSQTPLADEALQEEDLWAWEEAAEPEEQRPADLGAISLPADEQAAAEIPKEFGTENIPDWLTEPESDFFALASERIQEETPSAPSADEWSSELDDAAQIMSIITGPIEAAGTFEDTLRAAAAGDQADWFDEEPEATQQVVEEPDSMTAPDQAGDEWALAEASEDQPEEEPPLAGDVSEADELLEHAEETRVAFDTPKEDTPFVEDWLKPEAGAQFEMGEAASEEAVLDWLQLQAAEGDWLGAYAKPESTEAEPPEFEASSLEFEETAEPSVEPEELQMAPVEDLARKTDEWLAGMPEAEAVPDEVEVIAFEAGEATLFGEEELFAEFDAGPSAPEQEPVQTVEPEEDLTGMGVAEPGAAGLDAGEVPDWMSGLEPVELEETPKEEGLLARPYDPFEGGSAANVPEYRSAKETGILQPDENPDWMAAFGDEEAPVEMEVDEVAEGEIDFGETDTFLAALGIEAEEEAETEDRERVEEVEETEAALPVEEELVPPAEEEGAMPDWLAAITTSASEQFEDMRFEEAETYSSSAEAAGVVSDSDLDWLAPLGEETDLFQGQFDGESEARVSEKPLDMGAIFAGVESLGEEAEEAALDEAELPELDLGDLEQARGTGPAVEEIQSWFADMPVRAETQAESVEVEEDELFDFEFPETQVAQPGNLAHTSELEEDEDSETPWLDDESIADDFSFEEITPRWLRKPKESDQQTSSQGHDTAPNAPDWLRNVFEDEEFDE